MVATKGQQPTLQPLLHRLAWIGPNQDWAPRPDAGWRCAMAFLPRVTKCLYEHLHILMADLWADDQPIPELPCTCGRPMAMRRNPERRMRLLIGPQSHAGPRGQATARTRHQSPSLTSFSDSTHEPSRRCRILLTKLHHEFRSLPIAPHGLPARRCCILLSTEYGTLSLLSGQTSARTCTVSHCWWPVFLALYGTELGYRAYSQTRNALPLHSESKAASHR